MLSLHFINVILITILFQINIKLSHKLNVELTASESAPFSAYIFLNRSQPVVTSKEFHTTYLYSISLRVRYHDPKSEGGVREFKKSPVILYGRCPQGLNLPKGSISKLPCDPNSSETCEWSTLSFTQVFTWVFSLQFLHTYE